MLRSVDTKQGRHSKLGASSILWQDSFDVPFILLGDKSRSGIPYQLNHILADESVIKATANKAAKAVADSAKATLKTQQGVKKIAKGLVQLKNCLQTFEKTITV